MADVQKVVALRLRSRTPSQWVGSGCRTCGAGIKGANITSTGVPQSHEFLHTNSTNSGNSETFCSLNMEFGFRCNALYNMARHECFVSTQILSHQMLEQPVAHHGNTQIGGAT